uniref:Uncharacterized protein n=1 Tax=viral metagenome TaxID=1070528 RepID=A0A6M3IP54_9ZZZZ
MQELQSRSEARKSQREEAKKALEQTRLKLEKLENKDFNFKRLRDMSKDEKDKLTATEMELKQKAEQLEENQYKFTEQLQNSYKNEAMAVLVGNDKDLQKKVLYNYNKLNSPDGTKEEVFSKMRDAYNMLGASNNSINPVNAAATHHGPPSGFKQAGGTVDAGLAKNLGITEEELKKHNLKAK